MGQKTKAKNRLKYKSKNRKKIIDTRIYTKEETMLRNKIFGYEQQFRRSTTEHLMLVEDKCFEDITDTDRDWYFTAIHLKKYGAL